MADQTDDGVPDREKRRHERAAVTLQVAYEGADDLLVDYTDNLSTGGTFVTTDRELPIGAAVRLALSFPGLLAPIHIDGVVRWLRSGPEAGLGIEFADGPGRERLAAVIDRVRGRDPRLVVPLVRVLVVEDNPHVAAMVRRGLVGMGARAGELAFAVTTAANGHEALALLREQSFEAAIIDVYLPVIDGAHVIAAMRGELGLATMPVIAVSAGGAAARAAALTAGADLFIEKPMRLRQVIETIQALMARR